jgi:hypothetical protein
LNEMHPVRQFLLHCCRPDECQSFRCGFQSGHLRRALTCDWNGHLSPTCADIQDPGPGWRGIPLKEERTRWIGDALMKPRITLGVASADSLSPRHSCIDLTDDSPKTLSGGVAVAGCLVCGSPKISGLQIDLCLTVMKADQ